MVIAIYAEFLVDRNPHLQYAVLSSVPVLDVREDVGNLSVLFDGVDIRAQKKSLHVITIKVLNDSQRDILISYYDANDPLGVNVSVGKIVRADFVAASNSYLDKRLLPREMNRNTILSTESNGTTVLFPEVILEAREFFVIKLLVLHPEDTDPEIHPVGKIAGIRTIPVVQVYRQEPGTSLLGRVFTGNVFVQGVRLVCYGIGLIAVILLFVWLAMTLDEVETRRLGKKAEESRKRLIEDFRRSTSLPLQPEDEAILTAFTLHGSEYMARVLSHISNPKVVAYVTKGSGFDTLTSDEVRIAVPLRDHWMKEYLALGLIKKTADGLVVDERMRTGFQGFVEFLTEKGEICPPVKGKVDGPDSVIAREQSKP